MQKQQKSTFLYLSGVALILVAAWWRYAATGSLQVDKNPVTDAQLYPILALFFGGIALNFIGYVGFIKDTSVSSAKTKRIAYITVLLGVLMPQMLSNDITIYLAFGDLLNNGLVSYADATILGKSQYVEYVSADWLDCPNLYGPFLLLLFGAATGIGTTWLGSLLAYKVIVGIFGLLFVHLTCLFFEEMNGKNQKYNTLALVILAPVFWLQAVGQMHVDGIILTLIAAILYFFSKKNWVGAAICTAFVLLCKIMYGVVFIPFFVIYLWFYEKENLTQFFKKAIASLAIIASVTALFYAPFWEGTKTITAPLEYHEDKPPSRSHVEVLTDVIFYGGKLFGADSDLGVGNLATSDAQFKKDKLILSKQITKFFKLFGLLLAIWVFLGLAFAKNKKTVLHIFGKVFLVVVCFYSPIFHPWYFLLALPFFLFTETKSWVIYVAAVFSFSNLHEIAFTVPRASGLYLAMLPFVLFMVISFFIYFKKHFIIETWRLYKGKEL